MRAPLISLLLVLVAVSGAVQVQARSERFELKAGDFFQYRLNTTPDLPMPFQFDDGAQVDRANLTYRVDVLNVTQDVVSVQLTIIVDVPAPGGIGAIRYVGDEFAERATHGDFTFVKRLPLTIEQERAALVTRKGPDPNITPMVQAQGPVHLERVINATIEPAHQSVKWDDSNETGVWQLWIDPDMIPFEGSTNQTLSALWPDGPIAGKLGFATVQSQPIAGRALQRDYPGLSRWDMWWSSASPTQAQSLAAPVITNFYSEKTGIMIGSGSQEYSDDTLVHEFGLLKVRAVGDQPGFLKPTSNIEILPTAARDEVPGPGLGLLFLILGAASAKARRLI